MVGTTKETRLGLVWRNALPVLLLESGAAPKPPSRAKLYGKCWIKSQSGFWQYQIAFQFFWALIRTMPRSYAQSWHRC